MTYQYARIDLDKTNYNFTVEWQYIQNREPDMLAKLDDIYRTYCIYKKFSSVIPMFHSEYTNPNSDIIGYYDSGKLVAWSLIRRFDQHNAQCDQFAWTYHNPKLRMGIETMKTECAIYKERKFKYLYLEQAHSYKSEIDGFEILGPMN